MKLLTIFLLTFSLNAFSHCEFLTQHGGWSAEGQPGIVEINFDPDKIVSIHFMGGTLENPNVTDTRASWNCSNSMLNIKMNDVVIVGNLEKLKDTDMWSIRFEESTINSLSGRVLTSFRY